MEIEFDAASRGANVKFLSCAPHEEEWLLPPLTMLLAAVATVAVAGGSAADGCAPEGSDTSGAIEGVGRSSEGSRGVSPFP